MSQQKYINEKFAEEIREKFNRELLNTVTLTLIDSPSRCEIGQVIKEMVQELASLNDKIRIKYIDLDKEPELVDVYSIDKVPALLLSGSRDSGIAFFGSPSGYQLRALAECVVYVSKGEVEFSEDVRQIINSINKLTHLQLFVTASCRFCYDVSKTICKLAVANENVVVDIIMATEFKELAARYMVIQVPKLVVNGKRYIVGAPEEAKLVELICKYVNESAALTHEQNGKCSYNPEPGFAKHQ